MLTQYFEKGDRMSIFEKRQQVLKIMVANLDNPQPQVVHSERIAEKLDMTIQETCQLVKVMSQKGMLVSDLEGLTSLITREGVNCLSQ